MPATLKSYAFVILTGCCIAGAFSSFTRKAHPVKEPWIAPVWADTLKSPFPKEPLTLANGEELFGLYCSACHGETGYGDGAAGGALGEKPANFHDTLVTRQTDGALFWKMSTGKGNMPPFGEVFSEEQRWQLVAYIRELSRKKK